jgi:hypothetical protein
VFILKGILGRILSETASELHGEYLVWTAQAAADRIWPIFEKSHFPGSICLPF